MNANLNQRAAQYRAAKLDAIILKKKVAIQEDAANDVARVFLSSPISTPSDQTMPTEDNLTEHQVELINKTYTEIVGDGEFTADKWIAVVNKLQQVASDSALGASSPKAQSSELCDTPPIRSSLTIIHTKNDELVLSGNTSRHGNPPINCGQNSTRPTSWDDNTRETINWFMEQTNDSLPRPPFHLDKARLVIGTKFYDSLRSDIKAGPGCSRAKWGALQDDLKNLKTIFDERAKKESMSAKVTLRTLECLQIENDIARS